MNRVLMMASVALFGVVAACTTEIPNVDFNQLSCDDDVALQDSVFPCPTDHHCVQGHCQLRLFCTQPGALDGCKREAQRCQATVGDLVSSVACESGLYATTSTKAPDPVACNCPAASDNDDLSLLCVAMAGAPMEGAYPLFVLPRGGALPSNALGVPAEIPDWRWCVVPCSSDKSCPADHTCRPAAVVTDGLLEAQSSGRHTLGVCYPNRLFVQTSTAVQPLSEPDPDLCLSGSGCDQAGQERACQYQVESVPDHPFFPAGQAWTDRRALFGRCVDQGGLTPTGMGCVAGSDATCVSGICGARFCSRNCDPLTNQDSLCACREVEVTRVVDGIEVDDAIHLCAQR